MVREAAGLDDSTLIIDGLSGGGIIGVCNPQLVATRSNRTIDLPDSAIAPGQVEEKPLLSMRCLFEGFGLIVGDEKVRLRALPEGSAPRPPGRVISAAILTNQKCPQPLRPDASGDALGPVLEQVGVNLVR